MAHSERALRTAITAQPLNLPYPLESLEPSPPGTSKLAQNKLDFFLESTGQSSPRELKDHARKIQEEAYEIYHYPCIRRWAFMTTKAASQAVYKHVLDIPKDDPEAIYLELGCFTGTDSRKLVHDGWPADKVIGTDLRKEWFDLGFKLYNDRPDCKIAFLEGDIFSSDILQIPTLATSASSSPSQAPPLSSLTSLTPLTGHVRAISAFSFFHLFSEPAQLDLAHRCAALLSSKPGSVIFGAHQGMAKKGFVTKDKKEGKGEGMFCHDLQSWKDMWEVEVFPDSRKPMGEGKGTRVKVEAVFGNMPDLPRVKDGTESDTQTFMWSVMAV